MATGGKCVIGSFSQYKQTINASKQPIITIIETDFTKISLNLQNKINKIKNIQTHT